MVDVNVELKARQTSHDDLTIENLEKIPTLLANIISLLGTEVEVTLANKEKYRGILHGCSPEFDIGLSYAQKLSLGEEDRLFMTSTNVLRKIIFPSKDVVCLTGALQPKANNSKGRNSYATDAEIGSQLKNGGTDALLAQQQEREFEEWEHEGEYDESMEIKSAVGLVSNSPSVGNTSDGWTVEEMLRANEEKGITTSFDPNLTEYSTAEPMGSEEDRRKANNLAREIELNPLSKRQARLENDDEERDLDVETRFPQEEEELNKRQPPWQMKSRRARNQPNQKSRDIPRDPVGEFSGGSGISNSWRRSAGCRPDGRNRPPPPSTTISNLPTTSASDVSGHTAQPSQATAYVPTSQSEDRTSGETVRHKRCVDMPTRRWETAWTCRANADKAVEKKLSKFAFNPNTKPFIPAGYEGGPEALTKRSSLSGGGPSNAQQPHVMNQPAMMGMCADQKPVQVTLPMYHQQAQPVFLPQEQLQMAYASQQHQQLQQAAVSGRQYTMPPPFPTSYGTQQLPTPYVVCAGAPTVVATSSGAMEPNPQLAYRHHSAQPMSIQPPPHIHQGGYQPPLTHVFQNVTILTLMPYPRPPDHIMGTTPPSHSSRETKRANAGSGKGGLRRNQHRNRRVTGTAEEGVVESVESSTATLIGATGSATTKEGSELREVLIIDPTMNNELRQSRRRHASDSSGDNLFGHPAQPALKYKSVTKRPCLF